MYELLKFMIEIFIIQIFDLYDMYINGEIIMDLIDVQRLIHRVNQIFPIINITIGQVMYHHYMLIKFGYPKTHGMNELSEMMICGEIRQIQMKQDNDHVQMDIIFLQIMNLIEIDDYIMNGWMLRKIRTENVFLMQQEMQINKNLPRNFYFRWLELEKSEILKI
jgi:hypothetical protein